MIDSCGWNLINLGEHKWWKIKGVLQRASEDLAELLNWVRETCTRPFAILIRQDTLICWWVWIVLMMRLYTG